jgi:hypothetical protein
VSNSDGKRYLNDRLVVMFLGDTEIGRSVSAARAGFGAEANDGTFVIDVPLPYALTPHDVITERTLRPHYGPVPDPGVFDRTARALRIDLGDVGQRDTYVMRVPSKRNELTLKFVAGDATELGPVYTTPGYVKLAEGGRLSLTPLALAKYANTVDERDMELLGEPKTEYRRVDLREVLLDNCSGGTTRTASELITWDYARESQLGGRVNFSFAPWLIARAGLSDLGGTVGGSVTTRALQRFEQRVPMEAAPRSRWMYRLNVEEIWLLGRTRLKSTDMTLPYEARAGVRVSSSRSPAACG